jgi:toxin ParE1/3/4
LDGVLLYTERHWGKRQRDTYRRALYRGIRRLADHPGLGREREDYEPGTRGNPPEHHVIIYRATDTELHVARILHERQDIDAILNTSIS